MKLFWRQHFYDKPSYYLSFDIIILFCQLIQERILRKNHTHSQYDHSTSAAVDEGRGKKKGEGAAVEMMKIERVNDIGVLGLD
ncbi:hypothetical protein PIB30_081440, partial [Stylosanthes scabra]|nr:hypothetical protein [Stylosanthes scabra]